MNDFLASTSMSTMEFSITNRGELSLLYNGYRYTKKYEKRCGEVVWRCVNRPCSGKVIAKNREVLQENPHNKCIPDLAANDVQKETEGKQTKKRACVETDRPIPQVPVFVEMEEASGSATSPQAPPMEQCISPTPTPDFNPPAGNNGGDSPRAFAPMAKKRKRSLESQDLKVLENALNLLQSSTDVSHDPYYTYGLHIANELRRYDAQTLAHVKRSFADIMFQADMGQLFFGGPNPPKMQYAPHDPFTPHTSSPQQHLSSPNGQQPSTSGQKIFLPATSLQATHEQSDDFL